MTVGSARIRELLGVIADIASIVSTVAILVVGTVLVGAIASQRRSTFASVPQSVGRPPASATAAVNGLTTQRTALAIYPPGAVVAIVEFSDFQCPFCGRFAREVYPTIKSRLIDTGRVAYIVKQFPIEQIHSKALLAAVASDCAATQGRFWDMRAGLFGDQSDLGPGRFKEQARELKMDVGAFNRCMTTQNQADIRRDILEGRRLGVRGTPTFFVGLLASDGGELVSLAQRIVGNQPFGVFLQAVDAVEATALSRTATPVR